MMNYSSLQYNHYTLMVFHIQGNSWLVLLQGEPDPSDLRRYCIIVLISVCVLIDFLQGQQSSLCRLITFRILSNPFTPEFGLGKNWWRCRHTIAESKIVPFIRLYDNSYYLYYPFFYNIHTFINLIK